MRRLKMVLRLLPELAIRMPAAGCGQAFMHGRTSRFSAPRILQNLKRMAYSYSNKAYDISKTNLPFEVVSGKVTVTQ